MPNEQKLKDAQERLDQAKATGDDRVGINESSNEANRPRFGGAFVLCRNVSALGRKRTVADVFKADCQRVDRSAV